jgi:hypothetical protein
MKTGDQLRKTITLAIKGADAAIKKNTWARLSPAREKYMGGDGEKSEGE